MGATLQEMLQDRAALITQQRTLLETAKAAKRDFTQAEERIFNDLESKIVALDKQVVLEETIAGREKQLDEPVTPYRPGSAASRSAIGEYEVRNGVAILNKNQKLTDLKASSYTSEEAKLNMGKYLKGVVTGDWKNAELERKFKNQNAAGEYLIPTILSDRIIDLARNKTVLGDAGARAFDMTERAVTSVRQIADPTLHWKAENDLIIESDPVFDTVTHRAKTVAGLVRMSIEMFEDAHDIENIVVNALTSGLALEMDRVGLFGSGEGEEPRGLYFTPEVPRYEIGPNGAILSNYAPFSHAVEMIQTENGQPNAIIYAPRTSGAIDRLVDSTGQPLNPPQSFQDLKKLVTNQIPTDLEMGTNNAASAAFVGNFTNVLYGIRSGIHLDITGVGGAQPDKPGDAFTRMQILIRIYARIDVQFMRPKHFTIIEGITNAPVV